jgi:putative endonuclease
MLNRQQFFGKKSESIAAKFLKKQGYKILEQNYRSKLGEIDIIAKDKSTLVFVEVKARRSRQFGNPKWAITPKKKRKISMVALLYLKTTRQIGVKARFDVVSIDSTHEDHEIELIRNAFELAYE